METPPATRPLILAVDDEHAVGRSIERDLKKRYGARHRVLLADSGQVGLGMVDQIVRRGEPVALLVVDQRMPEMTGVDFLARAIGRLPHARRVLLTAYADTEAAIPAINEVGLDHYLMKPWEPPGGAPLPGPRRSPGGVGGRGGRRLAEPGFGSSVTAGLRRATPRVTSWRGTGGPTAGSTSPTPQARPPGAAHRERTSCRCSSSRTARSWCGPRRPSSRTGSGCAPGPRCPSTTRDPGAGPAGLAAAVYGASEGLRTLLMERLRRAARPAELADRELSRLPQGLTGADLARRAVAQARRFGAEMVCREAVGIRANGPDRIVALDGGEEIAAHASSSRPASSTAGWTFRGSRAHRRGGLLRRRACRGRGLPRARRSSSSGGANSAGQAAVYLAASPPGHADRARPSARAGHVALPGRTGSGDRQHPRDDGRAGRGGHRQRPAGGAERRRRRGAADAGGHRGLRLRRRAAPDRVARRRGGARHGRLHRLRPGAAAGRGAPPLAAGARPLRPRDQPAGRLRGR